MPPLLVGLGCALADGLALCWPVVGVYAGLAARILVCGRLRLGALGQRRQHGPDDVGRHLRVRLLSSARVVPALRLATSSARSSAGSFSTVVMACSDMVPPSAAPGRVAARTPGNLQSSSPKVQIFLV
jgi:hypothetical protein